MTKTAAQKAKQKATVQAPIMEYFHDTKSNELAYAIPTECHKKWLDLNNLLRKLKLNLKPKPKPKAKKVLLESNTILVAYKKYKK